MTTTSLLDLFDLAVDLAAEPVAAVSAHDLHRQTPCANWDLRTLLDHMTGQNGGFVEAMSGRELSPADFAPRAHGGGAWLGSARRAQQAFRAADPDQPVSLPEIPRFPRYPARTAIGFQLLDTVVHGWDVAVTLTRPYAVPAALADATLTLARAVPGGSSRQAPGAAFAAVRPAGHLDAWSQALGLLGRNADWHAAEA